MQRDARAVLSAHSQSSVSHTGTARARAAGTSPDFASPRHCCAQPGPMPCCGGPKDDDDIIFTPRKDRSCTDLFCLLLIFLMWGAMGFVAFTAMSTGSLSAIVHPKDYMGNYCGEGELAARPKAFYPKLDSDISSQLEILATGRIWQFTPCATSPAPSPSPSP